ncbi:MAG: triose-phosphate isomerase [Patescibacteria group bacterium]|nr:triose-phosphate isomerase [Patescibacteria group bacterium]MCL5224029.1 triose-phosphate isomerase [Patescibacteria group bacterium]
MIKLLVANWKANPETLTEAVRLAKNIDYTGVVIAPPFPFLDGVRKVIHKAKLAAQNVFWSDGPYTGEVSANQLKKLGVRYAIIGHSERRRNLNEIDAIINKKVTAALNNSIKPILCVGEGPELHKSGDHSKVLRFIDNQLKLDLHGIRNPRGVIIAYEPIWAIGTGNSDSTEHVSKVVALIKERLGSVSILYGGSVNPNNADKFMSIAGISGALIGGASLKSSEFKKIISISKRY